VEFKAFPKMARWSRDIIITEKIDGTNASIYIGEDGEFFTGSKNRWITPEDDNYYFSRWAHDHKEDLLKLGVGHHFGEWWGPGIQRGYGLKEKCFSLFNVHRWSDSTLRPECCSIVPTIYSGANYAGAIEDALESLKVSGSLASPGFMRPEGVVLYHVASGIGFKKTIEKDEVPKSITPKTE
jgi:hypothetical protein